jgi:hypothetical protein
MVISPSEGMKKDFKDFKGFKGTLGISRFHCGFKKGDRNGRLFFSWIFNGITCFDGAKIRVFLCCGVQMFEWDGDNFFLPDMGVLPAMMCIALILRV